jgi:hypothetical protein
MIRVVMFDLGQTLIDADNHPFPHVAEALTAVSGFKTAAGQPLRSCLLSDFTMATPPVTPAKVTALFNQYLAILGQSGLRPFFEPVKKRVTLSTHAGAMKPDRKIFEKALQRLGGAVPLEDCLFITENADHIDKARNQLHMQALQFRAAGASHFDFDDWAAAPALIANLVAPHQFANTHAAVKAHLAAQGIELLTAEPAETPGALKVSGQAWRPISVPGFKELDDVRVAIPVEAEIARGSKGEFESSGLDTPSDEQVAEATAFVRSLATQGQIAGQPGKHANPPTHAIETDEKGNRKLVRKRFTAL